jgi:Cu+-exporting ATPase
VLAGVVQARRSGLGAPTAAARIAAGAESARSVRAGHAPAAPAEAIDPVCGMTVDTATAEHRSEYAGKAYYFCCGGCKHSFEKEPPKYLKAVAR